MTYALIVAQYPTSNPTITEDLQWQTFVAASANLLKKTKSAEVLAQNVWLLDLQSDMPTFSLLIEQAVTDGFPCRTLFLDHKPIFCLS